MIKRIIALVLVMIFMGTVVCSAATTIKSVSALLLNDASGYQLVTSLDLLPTNGVCYHVLYNKYGRMVDFYTTNITTSKRFTTYIYPKEYPVTVKTFIRSKTDMCKPLSNHNTIELSAVNKIITMYFEDFLLDLDEVYNKPGSVMYSLKEILLEISDSIIADAEDDTLVIDREHLKKKYPEQYADLQSLSKGLDADKKDQVAADFLGFRNEYDQYNTLVDVLFTMLGFSDML